MKKVLLVVLILILGATPIVFTGCSNVSQRELLSTSYVCGDDGYELFTYDVLLKDEEGNYTQKVGTMTMQFERLKEKDTTISSLTEKSGEITFLKYTGARLTRS